MATARAHVERAVLESFARVIERTRRRDLREVLGLLCDLYALWHIVRDRAWFMEHGHISADKSKAITALVNSLCGEVRAQAVPLVDAWVSRNRRSHRYRG